MRFFFVIFFSARLQPHGLCCPMRWQFATPWTLPPYAVAVCNPMDSAALGGGSLQPHGLCCPKRRQFATPWTLLP
jgi:hypothetical protein